MSTDDPAAPAAATATATAAPTSSSTPLTDAPAADAPAAGPPAPSWWQREHPVFTPLAGFFAGLLFVLVVPLLFAGVVGAVSGSDQVGEVFPFVVVTLAVPLALVVFERTRRFGAYMWLGILTTAVVVLGVGGLVLWYMIKFHS